MKKRILFLLLLLSATFLVTILGGRMECYYVNFSIKVDYFGEKKDTVIDLFGNIWARNDNIKIIHSSEKGYIGPDGSFLILKYKKAFGSETLLITEPVKNYSVLNKEVFLVSSRDCTKGRENLEKKSKE